MSFFVNECFSLVRVLVGLFEWVLKCYEGRQSYMELQNLDGKCLLWGRSRQDLPGSWSAPPKILSCKVLIRKCFLRQLALGSCGYVVQRLVHNFLFVCGFLAVSCMVHGIRLLYPCSTKLWRKVSHPASRSICKFSDIMIGSTSSCSDWLVIGCLWLASC